MFDTNAVPPWLSVLTPSLNYARFVSDAVESVRMQHGGHAVEHILADGGSTDGTTQYLASLPDVRWFSAPDEGQSDALNKALLESSGAVIGWLNADEFYLQDTFDAVRSAFDQTNADVVYGDVIFVDESARSIRLVAHHQFDRFVLRNYGCSISTCSFFVRRQLIEECCWDLGLRYIMDWDLFLCLMERGARFHYIPKPLGAFRVHDARVTAQPLPLDSAERIRVARRHGLAIGKAHCHLARVLGRGKRIGCKLSSGAYLRQIQYRSQAAGEDVRWWPSCDPQ